MGCDVSCRCVCWGCSSKSLILDRSEFDAINSLLYAIDGIDPADLGKQLNSVGINGFGRNHLDVLVEMWTRLHLPQTLEAKK